MSKGGGAPAWMRREADGQHWIREESVELSQYGDRDGGYRAHPRWDRMESAVSMAEGHLTAEEVYRGMQGRPPSPAKGPKVRWFGVGRLLESDYAGHSTPTPRNPRHVSVVALTCEERDLPRTMDAIRSAWEDERRIPLGDLSTGEGR